MSEPLNISDGTKNENESPLDISALLKSRFETDTVEEYLADLLSSGEVPAWTSSLAKQLSTIILKVKNTSCMICTYL